MLTAAVFVTDTQLTTMRFNLGISCTAIKHVTTERLHPKRTGICTVPDLL